MSDDDLDREAPADGGADRLRGGGAPSVRGASDYMARGLRGEITLRLFNEAGPAPDDLGAVILERDGRRDARAVAGCRPCAGGLLLSFDGVASREEAAALTGSEVRVARDTLPPLGPG